MPSLAEEDPVDLCGAGDCVISVPHDLSFAGRTVAVDETASTTNYPAVAYPALQEFTVWRNVKLTDVKTFTAEFDGMGLGTLKASFSVADGELFVTFRQKNGFSMTVR